MCVTSRTYRESYIFDLTWTSSVWIFAITRMIPKCNSDEAQSIWWKESFEKCSHWTSFRLAYIWFSLRSRNFQIFQKKKKRKGNVISMNISWCRFFMLPKNESWMISWTVFIDHNFIVSDFIFFSHSWFLWYPYDDIFERDVARVQMIMFASCLVCVDWKHSAHSLPGICRKFNVLWSGPIRLFGACQILIVENENAFAHCWIFWSVKNDIGHVLIMFDCVDECFFLRMHFCVNVLCRFLDCFMKFIAK